MKFDLPIRIHWQPGDPVDGKHIASIRNSGPLVLILDIGHLRQLTALGLPWDGVSIVVIYGGWRLKDRAVLPDAPKRWEFPIDGPKEAKALAEAGFLGLDPSKAALRWFPRRGKMADLIPILDTAVKTGCGLTLPNRPAGVITTEGPGAFPAASEFSGEVLSCLKELTAALKPGQVRIHDYVLTEELGLDGVEPKGCEAANSIAFVDREGKVYPCETLMVPMGDLGTEELDVIWASPLKERIRRDVSSVPGICVACDKLDSCRGGCRGAVYHLSGDYGSPDPLCPVCADKQI